MSYIRDYESLKISQPEISNQSFEVLIADNVLLPEHIDEIYKTINNVKDEDTRINEWSGVKVWHKTLFSKDIEERIINVARQYIKEDIILDTDYSFARYSKEYGFNPKLFPHYDTRDAQRITFDIQIKTDEPWALVVENKQYDLKDNQALIFSGTQQIHWREKKELSKNSRIDMLFCHLKYKNPKPFDLNQNVILEERSKFLMEYTNIKSDIQKIG